MPDATDIQAIYDFETIFDAAIKSVFDAAGFTTLTRADTSEFQNARPRIEIVFKCGAGSPGGQGGASKLLQGITLDPTIPACSVMLAAAYRWACQFAIITNGTEDDKKAHAANLFNARWIIGTLAPRVNYARLTKHIMNSPIIPGDTTTAFKKEEGYWVSNFSAEGIFTINDNAWQALMQ